MPSARVGDPGPLEARACPAELLDDVIRLVDEEFLEAKGRRISMARRYPTVFDEDNLHNIAIVVVDGRVAATAAAKAFRWCEGGRITAGAMIGGVATARAQRGQGYARAVLCHLEDSLRARRTEFAVLWTSMPGLYQPLGWVSQDVGLFGEVELPVSFVPRHDVIRLDVSETPYDLVEAVRAQWLPARTLRDERTYTALPLPAETVDLYVAREDAAWRSYAIVGRRADDAFIYEVVGDADAWSSLFSALARGYRTVHVNTSTGAPVARWLESTAAAKWQRQSLAMWKMFAPGLRLDDLADVYIPYLDRI